MLVLSRKVGQRILIGDNITILISRVAGKRVTLGLEAPKDVSIRRAELEPITPAADSEKSNENSDEEGDEEPGEEDHIPSGRMVVSLAPHPLALLQGTRPC